MKYNLNLMQNLENIAVFLETGICFATKNNNLERASPAQPQYNLKQTKWVVFYLE